MSDPQQQVQFLSTLIHLEKRFREAVNVDELTYRLANETGNLVKLDQLLIWQQSATGNVSIRAIRGVDRIVSTTPFAQQMVQLIRSLNQSDQRETVHAIKRAECDIELHDGNDSPHQLWNHLLWVPLCQKGQQPNAGLVILRQEPAWSEQEKSLFEHLAEAADHAWRALQPRRRLATSRRRWFGYALLILSAGLMCLPIRLSVLAPGEVIPQQMVMVTSALDGIVKSFHIKPNQEVKKGQLLVTLDRTALINRVQIAQKAWAVVKAEYQHARQRSFGDPETREKIHLFKTRMAQKKAEADYVESLLDHTLITAPRDGVALFNDENDWLGRPVIIGEKILTVASPQLLQLRAMVPVNNAIMLDPEAKIVFFLNVAPTSPLTATISQIGYQAINDTTAGLAFPIKADFIADVDSGAAASPRIGLRGTAKLYGKKVPLIYAVLRKPLTRLRHFIGI